MSYQPPLIGSKQLLNFTATSLPATGGLLAIASVILAVAAPLVARRDRATRQTRSMP
jgi:copper chaperone NosL